MLISLARFWNRLPNHPMKLRLVNGFCALLGKNVRVRDMNSVFDVDGSDYLGRTFLLGGFERDTVSAAKARTPDGGVFVDVGANFGLFTVAMSENPTVKCIAFEPDRENFERLVRNVRLNGRSNAILANAALSESNGFVGLEQWLDGNKGAIRATGSISNGPVAAALRGDTALAALNVDRIDCMKIDVEGAELMILRSLDLTPARRPRCIILEFVRYTAAAAGLDAQPDHRREIWDLLHAKGYLAYDIFGRRVDALDLDFYYPESNLVFVAQ